MIVCLVDSDNCSYANWADPETGEPLNFDYDVITDVIGYMDNSCRTIVERKGRAIIVISLGANGTITYELTYLDKLCSVPSHSGGYKMDDARAAREATEQEGEQRNIMLEHTTVYYVDIDMPGFSTKKDRTPKGKIYTSVEQINRVDPYRNEIRVPPKGLPHIYIDAGAEDFLYRPTVQFMIFLQGNKIPFVFGQFRSQHEEVYRDKVVSVSVAVQQAIMLRNIWGKEFEVYNPYHIIFGNYEKNKKKELEA